MVKAATERLARRYEGQFGVPVVVERELAPPTADPITGEIARSVLAITGLTAVRSPQTEAEQVFVRSHGLQVENLVYRIRADALPEVDTSDVLIHDGVRKAIVNVQRDAVGTRWHLMTVVHSG